MQQEVKSKIANPERIARILKRMCDGAMYCLIRVDENAKVGIRANFHSLATGKKSQRLIFSGISEYGLAKLKAKQVIRLEVIGMPSKVVFQVTVLKTLGAGGITCSLPKSLISIERRAASRVTTNTGLCCFLELSVWKPQLANIDSPPSFYHHLQIHPWLYVLDISSGGVCIQTFFPGAANATHSLDEDPEAKLLLPMSDPIDVKIAFRWHKKIKNRLKTPSGDDRYQIDFRMGLEFIGLKESNHVKIKQFIRQLTVSQAI